MLKITNYKMVQGQKIFTMKDSDNANQKITIIDGIVTIEEKGKKDITLKAQTRTKKFLEVIASYEAKKEVEAKKKAEKEAKKNTQESQIEMVIDEKKDIEEVEEIENVEVIHNVEILDDIPNNDTLIIENNAPMQENNGQVLQLHGKTLGQKMEEKEKKYLIDVIANGKEEEYHNLDLRISLIDVMIDDTCKAHKVANANGGERWTNFTMFIGSDNKVLDVQLMNAMQIMMDKYLQLLEQKNFEEGRKFFRGDMAKFNTYNGIIMKNGNSIQIPFWENNVVEYREGNMECMKNILRIPYQNNVGEIRKFVHIAYYLAKKQVLNFYKGMKKIKLQQQKEAEKQRKQA